MNGFAVIVGEEIKTDTFCLILGNKMEYDIFLYLRKGKWLLKNKKEPKRIEKKM